MLCSRRAVRGCQDAESARWSVTGTDADVESSAEGACVPKDVSIGAFMEQGYSGLHGTGVWGCL